MAGVSKSIAGRMTLAVFLVHLVVLPVLYFLLLALMQQSNEDQFLNYVRGYTRFVADSLEGVDGDDTKSRVAEILDGFMLSGTGLYAVVEFDDETWYGTIGADAVPNAIVDDFSIGEDGDAIYDMSVPVSILDRQAALRLGFDEHPIMQQNRTAYIQSAVILVSYLLIVLFLVALIGKRVTKPIRALQKSSRRIASGEFHDRLIVDSDLIEFVELSRDLDLMCSKLTGANQLLQKEIQDRIRAEDERASLEVQLRHKQRIETVGTLAGGIAHELNNILVPILLFSEMAMDDLPQDSAAQNDLKRVVKSANRAKSIVRQVLAFSRQFDETELQPVDLSAVLSDSIAMLRPAMPPTIQIDQDIRLPAPIVNASESMLGQLLVNLLTNAYQSMLANGGRIRVTVEECATDQPIPIYKAELPAGRYVRLSVSDSGSGIDAVTMERIFEPFYSTKEAGDGTGLGLSVVHGIVTSLGGGIALSSELHVGSTFSVYLPLIVRTST